VKAYRRPIVILLLAGSVGCRAGRQPASGVAGPPPAAQLTAPDIAVLINPRVKERAAWAQAVFDALAANDALADLPSVCGVLAVIAQESSFTEDPVVPGLARIVETRIESYRSRLGPLGDPLFRRLLDGRVPPDPRSFDQRLHAVRTEHDLDLVFRDMLAYHQSKYPGTFDAVSLVGKLFDVRNLAELNPITTAGPMQVSVHFAEDWARDHHGQTALVRDSLYTRAGGVYYGTARLLGYPAGYSKMLFRFADYNAGMYSSRNAAVQAQLSRLVGRKLALDGDVLAYGKDGQPSNEATRTMEAIRLFRDRYQPALSDERLRDDARQEKTLAFETSDTYRAIKSVFAAKVGSAPEYAILPQVELSSPKLGRKLSTSWYAQAVDRRFQSCLASAPR
jgi:Protein of unknown function (DUF1615)